jgi:phage tail sheath gpL-like
MATVVRSFDPLARASANSVTFKQLNLEQAPAQRPEIIGVLAQAATAKAGTITANVPVLADGTPEQAFGLFGASPLYYAAEKLFPKNGNGAKCPVYYIPIADGSAASVGTIAYAGTASRSFVARLTFRELTVASAADMVGKIATNALLNPARAPRAKKLDGFNTLGVRFSILKGNDQAAITTAIIAALAEEPTFPAVATAGAASIGTFTSKWKGSNANFEIGLVLDNGDPITAGDTGLTLTVTQPTGGTDATSLTTALANMTAGYGFTRLVNQFDDTTNLDLVQTWGEGMRDSLIAQYCISYSAREYIESQSVAGTVDIAAIKTLGDARRLDAVNSILYGTYGDLRELTYTQRDTLLKAGICNVELRNGVATLMDAVTLYHPTGVQNPIFQFDENVTKIGNLAYDMQYFFGQEEWESKILVSTTSKTTNPDAMDIIDFAAAVNGRAELWEKTALIASAEFVKENSVFAIDDNNPCRINANIKAQLSSTLRITDNTLFLGFLFGESA